MMLRLGRNLSLQLDLASFGVVENEIKRQTTPTFHVSQYFETVVWLDGCGRGGGVGKKVEKR